MLNLNIWISVMKPMRVWDIFAIWHNNKHEISPLILKKNDIYINLGKLLLSNQQNFVRIQTKKWIVVLVDVSVNKNINLLKTGFVIDVGLLVDILTKWIAQTKFSHEMPNQFKHFDCSNKRSHAKFGLLLYIVINAKKYLLKNFFNWSNLISLEAWKRIDRSIRTYQNQSFCIRFYRVCLVLFLRCLVNT